MAYLGQTPIVGKYSLCDDISSGFNGSTTTFALTDNTIAFSPGSARNLLVSLGNVIKKPETDYNVSGSSITFASAPANGTAFFALSLGDAYAIGSPSDGTVKPSAIANSGDFAFPADIRLKDADGSNYVGFQSPSTVSNNIVWTLPSEDAATSGYALVSNANGVLSWSEATANIVSDARDNTVAGSNTGSALDTDTYRNIKL